MKTKYIRFFIALQILKKAIQELDEAWEEILMGDGREPAGNEGYPQNWSSFDEEKHYIYDWVETQEKLIKTL